METLKCKKKKNYVVCTFKVKISSIQNKDIVMYTFTGKWCGSLPSLLITSREKQCSEGLSWPLTITGFFPSRVAVMLPSMSLRSLTP